MDRVPLSRWYGPVLLIGGIALWVVALAMLALQILALGFVRDGWVGALSHPSIAHALILAVMASMLIDHGWRLNRYARDAALDAAE